MKTDHVARPAGRQPAAVYWRRRAVVVTVMLIAVWLLARACSGGSDASNAAARTPGATTSPSAAGAHAATTAAPSGAAAAGSTPSPGGTLAAPTAVCDPSTLSLRAAVSAMSFHRPFKASITLLITTRAASPCGLDPSLLQAQVMDGSRVVWSSSGCGLPVTGSPAASGSASGTPAATPSSTAPPELITVSSEGSTAEHYTWPGTTCGGPLAPGLYDVVGRLQLGLAYAGTVSVS